MLKHTILFIAFSIVAMFFQSELGQVLHYLLMIHDKIADALASIFSNAPAGRIIQETIALIIIPVVAGGVAALVFWLIKRSEMPHIMATVWFVWTILLVVILAQPSGQTSTTKRIRSSNSQTMYVR